jgi:PAS domain S-box-containing protein
LAKRAEILIVEDEPVQALKLQLILEEHGYSCSVARSGEEALEVMEQTFPTLVISDVVMAGIDGYELCRRIRSDARFRVIRVTLLTSLAEPDDVITGLASGADNFLSKPTDVAELLVCVDRALNIPPLSGSVPAPLAIRFDGKEYAIPSTREQILNFFLSAYESAIQKTHELGRAHAALLEQAESLEHEIADRTAALREEVAERKHAEEKSRERAALLDKAQDAILVCDLQDRVVYWNKSAARLYGWTSEEALGRSAGELLHSDASPLPEDAAASLRERGEWTGELQQFTRDERKVIVQSRWTLVRDDLGVPKSTLIINTDVTEKRELEQQFLRTQRMESIGTLAGGIAHDLNNLLAPILLAIDLLEQNATDDRTLRTIGLIESSARRAADMVKQVLTFARGMEGERTVLQIPQLIEEMAGIGAQSFPKMIDFSVSCPEMLPPVMGDATQLQQVLMNLCVNARDAMPHGGTITLSAEHLVLDEHYAAMNPEAHPGPYVLLRVRDSGTGMPPQIMEKIFEPFFTTKEIGKGTGLGLSTVLAIVRSHKGFIRVKSEPGKGTEFQMYLPATGNDEADEGVRKHTHAPEGKGELIMVVDDELVIREITRATLEDHGYRVIEAEDGAEAVALYAQHRGEIAAVILDMVMPFLDGPGTIRALQRMDPGVSIVAVSGLAENLREADAAAKRPVPQLPKPYTTEQLLTVLDAAIRRSVIVS